MRMRSPLDWFDRTTMNTQLMAPDQITAVMIKKAQ